MPAEWAAYTELNARWYKDKASARATVDEWKPAPEPRVLTDGSRREAPIRGSRAAAPRPTDPTAEPHGIDDGRQTGPHPVEQQRRPEDARGRDGRQDHEQREADAARHAPSATGWSIARGPGP